MGFKPGSRTFSAKHPRLASRAAARADPATIPAAPADELLTKLVPAAPLGAFARTGDPDGAFVRLPSIP